tara:strand:+ start:452 stop:700 length:249 start_codon:yes stop_codon:yes gene_type:complete
MKNGIWRFEKDLETTLNLWLQNLTGEEIWDIFQDLDDKDFEGLAKLFNNDMGQEKMGIWLNKVICQKIKNLPEFWEKFDEYQ